MVLVTSQVVMQPGDRLPAPPELALAQDLANTIDIEQDKDSLVTPAALEAFAAAHALPGLTFDQHDLERCLVFREALRDVCQAHAGADMPASSLEALRAALARAPLVLSPDSGGAVNVTVALGAIGTDGLVAHIAAGITNGVVNGSWSRLKACAAAGCRWVYYDHSPAGRGRWCTMQICGSRDKVRTYRQRRGRTASP